MSILRLPDDSLEIIRDDCDFHKLVEEKIGDDAAKYLAETIEESEEDKDLLDYLEDVQCSLEEVLEVLSSTKRIKVSIAKRQLERLVSQISKKL